MMVSRPSLAGLGALMCQGCQSGSSMWAELGIWGSPSNDAPMTNGRTKDPLVLAAKCAFLFSVHCVDGAEYTLYPRTDTWEKTQPAFLQGPDWPD